MKEWTSQQLELLEKYRELRNRTYPKEHGEPLEDINELILIEAQLCSWNKLLTIHIKGKSIPLPFNWLDNFIKKANKRGMLVDYTA